MSASPTAVHVIPYDAIGGVELAARSLPSGSYPGLRVQKAFLARRQGAPALRPGDYCGRWLSENDPRNFFLVLRWLDRERPALLVASLWRCYLVLIFHKLLHPQSKWVCFLHLPRCVHVLDAVFSWLAMLCSTQIWADSQATLDHRVPARWRRKALVVPLLLEYRQPVTDLVPQPKLVFWGRLSLQKDLTQALKIVQELNTFVPHVQFWIIGPDAGEQANLEGLVQHLKLIENVHFCGAKSFQEITQIAANCSFYLQTSHSEGMALSVVEAMQLGLVPVVTPVGEIANYCHDCVNALLVSNPRATAARIAGLLNSPALYSALRHNAISTWAEAPLYSDGFLQHGRDLLC